MAIEDLVLWLVIGGVAGWLASLIVTGYGLGLIGNIVAGIAGASIAGWLLPHIGFVLLGGILAKILNAVIGARDSPACDRSLQSANLKLTTVCHAAARCPDARSNHSL